MSSKKSKKSDTSMSDLILKNDKAAALSNERRNRSFCGKIKENV